MGNTLTGETLDTWNDADVKKWQEEARMQQQCLYLQFEGAQFHDITDLSTELRVTKIAFAIYGPPQKEAKTLEDAYSAEQREFASKVYEKIRETYIEAPIREFRLGFVFICCKEGDKKYQMPLFRLCWNDKNGIDASRWIDTNCRVYKTAQDWKDNNPLPMMKYCYPQYLYYSCANENDYEFDVGENVSLGFGTSPACDLLARLGRIGDVVITATAMTVGVVSLLTPAGFISGPILLSVGATSGVYGAGRAINRLVDKGTHGESLSDLESILLFISIVAAPLNMLSGLANARLAAGAAAGRIFSQSERVLATLLILTTFGVDSFSIILNIANLIEKKKRDALTGLDILQFSVSLLFFGNAVMQPKTASGVIARAQQAHIGAIAEQMTDQQAKEAFKSYLNENKGDGGIKATSRMIRNVNRMEDPNSFFKGASAFDSVKIGGRKGKTVLLTNGDGQVQRANPNKVFEELNPRVKFSSETQSGVPKVQKPAKLRECLGTDYETHELLGRLTPQQKGRLNKVFGGAAHYDKKIVDCATQLAKKMNVRNDPDAFMSLVEVVAAEAKGNTRFDFNNTADFQRGVTSDLAQVRKLAATRNLRFADDFKALYHYRKHGAEFMEMCTLKFYLGKLPGDIQANGRLADVCDIKSVHPDGTVEMFTRKTYYKPDDSMLVTIEKDGVTKISTMFKRPGGWDEYTSRCALSNVPPPEIALENFARLTGLSGVRMVLHSADGKKTYDSVAALPNRDQEAIEKLVAMLVSDRTDFLDDNNNDE